MKNKILTFALGLLAGILTAFSTPIIYGVFPLVFCSLIPLIKRSEKYNSITHLILLMMGYSLGFNLLGFFWVSIGLNSMWKIPYWQGSLMAFPLWLLSEVQIFFTVLTRKILAKKYSPTVYVLGTALAFGAFESLCQTLFPDAIGLNLMYSKSLIQGLDITGVSLFSSLIWLSNEVVYLLVTRPRSAIKATITTAVIYGSLFLYGNAKLNEYEQVKSQSISIKALMVQPNINHRERDAARTGNEEKATGVLNSHYQQTLEGFKDHPDSEFIIWPETMYPFYYQSNNTMFESQKEIELNNFLKDKPITLFFGSFGKTMETPFIIKNNMYGISHYGEVSETNRWEKMVLFPFGEYIPMVKYFPWLKIIFPKSNTPTPANKPSLITVGPPNKRIVIGSAICYEVLFSHLFQQQAKLGADIIINISNESFFGTFAEPELNLLHARARAIETRTPVLKTGNIGYSGGIEVDGNVIGETKSDTVANSFANVPVIQHKMKSLYVTFGDWFCWMSLAVVGGLIIMAYRRPEQ